MKKKRKSQLKNAIPVKVKAVKPPWKKRQNILLALCVLVLSAGLLVQNYKSNAPQREARMIINRALEITQTCIPDSQKVIRDLLVESLHGIQIEKNPGEQLQLPQGQFFLVIVPGKYLSGSNDPNSTALMSFRWEELKLYGKVTVLMNEDIGKLSGDLDAKATCLIHELIHGLQAGQHLAAGQKEISPEMRFGDEMIAWNSQVYLYQKLHPEVFNGLSCLCETGELLGMNEYQKKILSSEERDNMVYSLVLFWFCKDTFLKKMYPTGK